MSTINVITVSESNVLDNAVVVVYEDLVANIAAEVTVVNVDGNLILTGLPMSKYTWMRDTLRVHPVARKCEGGTFVSIKETRNDLLEAAKELAPHLLGIEVFFEEEEGELVEVFQEEVIKTPVKRLTGSFDIPVVSIVQEEVKEVQEMQEAPELIDYQQVNDYLLLAQEEANCHYSFDEYYNYDTNVDSVVSMEEEPLSSDEVSIKVLEISYRYFRDTCSLKSLNREQIRQQFGIIYRKHLLQYHCDSEVVGKVISYLIEKLLQKYGRRTFVYKDVFLTLLASICSDVKAKLLSRKVA